MNLVRAASSFTPEQLQFIGTLAVLGAIPFLGFVWRMATWTARVEYDLDNLGKILETKKGLARAARRHQKTKEIQVKELLKAVWLNHKKKIIAILIMILSGLGLLSADLRQAIHEATAPAAVEAPAQPIEMPVAPAEGGK